MTDHVTKARQHLDVLETFDLQALIERFADEGFEVHDYIHRDPVIAAGAKIVRAVDPDHVERLSGHHWLDTVQAVPTCHVLADWPNRAREAIDMLRVATGRTHADLGPTTTVEAAFARLAPPVEAAGDIGHP